MRGAKAETGAMFSYLSPEERVPKDHPLRAIRVIVDRSLAELDGHFNQIYSDLGRPSIPPEHLLRALLLQVFYYVHSGWTEAKQRHPCLGNGPRLPPLQEGTGGCCAADLVAPEYLLTP